MNKKLAYFLLICLSLSVLGLAFHHHKHGATHDNCAICFHISHHSNLVCEDVPQISAPSYNNLLIFLENTFNIPYSYSRPYSIRGPPA